MSETKYDRWKTTAPDPYLEPEEQDPDVLRDAERDEPDYQDLACVDFEDGPFRGEQTMYRTYWESGTFENIRFHGHSYKSFRIAALMAQEASKATGEYVSVMRGGIEVCCYLRGEIAKYEED